MAGKKKQGGKPFRGTTIKTQVTVRQSQVTEMYLSGYSQEVIAEKLGVSQACVSITMARARENWKERSREAYDEWLAVETARIEDLYRRAHEAYERSIKPRTATNKAGETITIEPVGDPRFLERMEKLLTLSARIRGALGEVNINIPQAGKEGYNWDELFPKPPPRPVDVIEYKPGMNGTNGDSK